ncbi:MAG: efflux transporter outer membrane subunit [Gammaproteobacteria bacterium]|nr:efflux transporter outer membrane subunit [Gammaproteobacteria bacterium]
MQNKHKNGRLVSRVSGVSLVVCATFLQLGCTVGPDYKRPPVLVTPKYKEASKHWKMAEPHDLANRGAWWKIFHDPALSRLEEQLDASNQTIATAAANYQNALDLVDEARASFFPVVTTSVSLTRQRQASSGSSSFTSVSSSSSSSVAGSPNSATTGVATGGGGSSGSVFTTHSVLFSGSWVPDIWGQVRRTVEASVGGAQASHALLAATRLSAESLLAQDYFQLRALDGDQKLLDDTVKEYKKALKLTQNRYQAGVAAQADVVQAQTQLESAEASATDNNVNRSKFEHAIAVLIGEPPALFALARHPLTAAPPAIPIQVPSDLLERRPDIAQAERLMAQANANIGVAISAYFPTLTLSANGNVTGRNYRNWFSIPALSWSVGPQLAETLFDGGLRNATVAANRATYDSTVASYRQTVLAAFQNVEDNMSSLRILDKEEVQQRRAANSAVLALKLVTNQYKAGLVDYSSVITAQNAAFAAQKNVVDVNGLRMTAAVGLVEALGGGWDASVLY